MLRVKVCAKYRMLHNRLAEFIPRKYAKFTFPYDSLESGKSLKSDTAYVGKFCYRKYEGKLYLISKYCHKHSYCWIE